MTDRLANELRSIILRFTHLPVYEEFRNRLFYGGPLTRDENSKDHFCIFFVGYDPSKKMIFVGHHIKSNLWAPNGGHIDANETLKRAVIREIEEEWGLKMKLNDINDPMFLTITPITHLRNYACEIHYDLWFFILLDMDNFYPDNNCIHKEFHKMLWLTVDQCRELVTDRTIQNGLDFIEQNLFS